MSFEKLTHIAEVQRWLYDRIADEKDKDHDAYLKRVKKMKGIQKKNAYTINQMKLYAQKNDTYVINWDYRIMPEYGIV